MSERPLLLFPEPRDADKTKGKPFPPGKIYKPTMQRQYERLTPVFEELTNAFSSKRIVLQQSSVGIDPEYALVFEVIGSVDNFYKAVNKLDGLEWLFDQTISIEPDDDFYTTSETGDVLDNYMSGRLYCIMTNQAAMRELLSMWKRYSQGEENVFPRGITSLRDVFLLLKSIRLWNAQDRIHETNAMEYWMESLSFEGTTEAKFEVELFYRSNNIQRTQSVQKISEAMSSLGGEVLKICCIEEISYHSMLVQLPKNQIENLVKSYEDVSLVHIDDIMFFRPVCQSVFSSENADISFQDTIEFSDVLDDPIIAVFDGMPMQNHQLIKNLITIDDPDEYEKFYQVKDRKHGTSMVSLVLHGDINTNNESLKRKVYVRPIMKPYTDFYGNTYEQIPNDVMIVDLIHSSVKRMIEGDGGNPPTSPNVKIINLSIGDQYRQFATTISPLARLLDWLSFQYKILFIVSAGNQNKFTEIFNEKFASFKSNSLEERSAKVFKSLSDYKSYLKVLSPAESINTLTIGALYSDFCEIEENQRQAFALKNLFPSPISAIGFAYNNMINPDLYYYGGRKFLIEDLTNNKMRWLNNTSKPGCKSAYPSSDGTTDGCAYTFGTSDATAQITHEAGVCYEVLLDIFNNESELGMESNYVAVLIKSMLVHGATWESIGDELATYVDGSSKKLSRWLGHGIPDISKVRECAKNRVTLIGTGELSSEKAHMFELPLPFNFSASQIKRKLTITLAYITPTESNKQKYRGTQLYYEVENLKNLEMTRLNSDWQKVRQGTVQHETFYGDKAVVWDENNSLIIKVNCKEDALKTTLRTPYALFVTFEVAEGVDLDVYTSISNKIKVTEKVRQPSV